METEILKFSLKLYNNKLLARNAVEEVINEVDNLITNIFLPNLHEQVRAEVCSKEDEIFYFKVKHVLEKNLSLFQNFNTEHKRFKYYREKCSFIEPEQFELGTVDSFQEDECPYSVKDDVQDKTVYAAYVSIPKTFKTLLSNSYLFDEMYSYALKMSQDDSSLSNFIQGDLWRNYYQYDFTKDLVFPMFAYFDEFQCKDPFSSHVGEQKLGGVYVSWPCLPPYLSSKLEYVFLSTLFHAKHLKKFPEKAFSKLIEDVRVLSEEGIDILVHDQVVKIFFECVLILGDNLGANSICGFQECFVANKFCRICTADKSICETLTVENIHLLRTVASYEKDLALNDVLSTGIKKKCMFNEMKNYHIARNIYGDSMHDFHGVAAYTLAKLIDYYIDKGDFDLDTLNNRIASFPYNSTEKSSKPVPIFREASKKNKNISKIKIRQSAAELMCLVRYFGLIIGDKIQTPSKHWSLYKHLRGLAGLLSKPNFEKSDIQNLQFLIEKHNTLYFDLFGPLKPKMHFLLHYHRLILLYGPAVHFSCLQFEQANRIMKEATAGTASCKNLPLTIAYRNQLSFCYKMHFSPKITSEIILGPCNKQNVADLSGQLREQIPFNYVSTLKYVLIFNHSFSSGTVCIIRFDDDGPRFGLLNNIFYVNDTDVRLSFKTFKTVVFDSHYQAYRVRSEHNNVIVNLNMLPKNPPCLYIKKFDAEFIATRYNFL